MISGFGGFVMDEGFPFGSESGIVGGGLLEVHFQVWEVSGQVEGGRSRRRRRAEMNRSFESDGFRIE